MIHKKKEKRRTFCYLKPTVVATEGTLQVMANVVDKNLNSTLATTEGVSSLTAARCISNLNSTLVTTEDYRRADTHRFSD